MTQLDVLYGALLSENFNDHSQQTSASKSTSCWQKLLQQWFTDGRLDGDKIIPTWRTSLPLKSLVSQKEKNSLLQDLLMIIRGDKALFKPVLDAAKSHAEAHRRKSVALFITKQLFSGQSAMRFLKR